MALVLGIESSCDETAASVTLDGRKVLSDAVYSQIDIHELYGGVVPEIASRKHIEKIIPAIAIISPAFIVLPNSALMTLFMLFHLP